VCQLLQLINEGISFIESFVNTRLLVNVWNWKSFIAPYLLTRDDSFMDISLTHHMKFSKTNGVAQVQYKHYSQDPWGPTQGSYSDSNASWKTILGAFKH
jgi:hypothetical protein